MFDSSTNVRTRRGTRHLLAYGAAVLAVAWIASGTAADPGPPRAGASAAPHPDYDCTKGGFCGSDGWEYGSYAKDTKESSGCGVGEDGVDKWDLSASHAPILPSFARPYCAFFYGFGACAVPTVVCEN